MSNARIKWTVIVTLLVTIIGCGAYLLPDWSVDLGQYRSYNFTFPAQDQQSFFHVHSAYPATELNVDRLDSTGQQVSHFQVPYQQAILTSPLVVPGAHDDFYVVARDPQQMLYANASSGQYQRGLHSTLAVNQSLYYQRTLIDDAGRLVFQGYLFTDEFTSDFTQEVVVGIINPHMVVESLRVVSGVEYALAFQRNDAGHLFLVANHKDAVTSEMSTTFVELDQQLNLVQRDDRSIDFDVSAQLNSSYLGSISEAVGQRTVVLSGNGEELLTLASDFKYFARFYPAASSVYQVHQIVAQESAAISFEICQFSYSFKKNWCRTVSDINGSSVTLEKGWVAANGELLLVFMTQWQGLLGAGIDVDSLPDGASGDLDLLAEERWQLHYRVFGNDGERLMDARAEPYYHRGKFEFCGFFGICAKPEQVHEGYCDQVDSWLTPNHELYSFAARCPGLGRNLWHLDLLHWTAAPSS